MAATGTFVYFHKQQCENTQNGIYIRHKQPFYYRPTVWQLSYTEGEVNHLHISIDSKLNGTWRKIS